jgi:hypothetical protein
MKERGESLVRQDIVDGDFGHVSEGPGDPSAPGSVDRRPVPGADSETSVRRAVITARATATFEPVGRSVASARAFVRDTLQGWGFSDIVDDAVVLTSELVTNAVVHAGTAAEVPRCTGRGRRPLPGARTPAPEHRPSPRAPGP